MYASLIIPVWKGATVIANCLEAVFAQSGDRLLEVICVDNASPDEAASIITQRFPQVRLISQPVNLGFAGGVNSGLQAARGEVGVLLNQDCIVQAGWLEALLDALAAHPEFGIAGCTILNADGTLNHAGAQLRRPLAQGEHLTDRGNDEPRAVDYVTGAAMAIRRATWETIGLFDDGFYPAYYEEVDFCYRARQHGFQIGYVPTALVQHLFSSREWQHDPIRHWATQQHCRYRFVCKHFDTLELTHFFEMEAAEIAAEPSFEMNAARWLGGRDTLRELPEIVRQQQIDLGVPLTAEQLRLLHAGFAQITRQAFAAMEQVARTAGYLPLRQPKSAITIGPPPMHDRLSEIARREQWLLSQAFFTTEPSALRRGLKRLASLFSGREHRLLTELSVLHVQRLDLLEQQTERRLTLLETLMDYDYR